MACLVGCTDPSLALALAASVPLLPMDCQCLESSVVLLPYTSEGEFWTFFLPLFFYSSRVFSIMLF